MSAAPAPKPPARESPLREALATAVVVLVATAAASAAAGAFVSGLVAAVAGAVVAGAVVFALRHNATPLAGPAADNIPLREALAANSQLRHDIRGALSPALLVSDRLTGHPEPAVAKAGDTVVRAVLRATAILEANKAEDTGIMGELDGKARDGRETGVSPPAR